MKVLNGKIRVRRFAAVLFVILALLGGALVAAPKLAGQRVPVYVAASPRQEATLPSNGFAPVVKNVLPAVVNISSSRIVSTRGGQAPFDDPFFRQFFGDNTWRQFHVPRERREQSLGSGVIVSPDGYILTNNHVVDGATAVKVSLPDKREFTGHIIGRDPKTDVAVVKIDTAGLPTVVLGNSGKLEIGDYVLAVGDPFGIGETVTMGIVSAKGRGGLSIEDYEDFIQTDAAINPGNSGGALINSRGELVGINTAILSNGGGNQGVGFAIPINMARNVMDQIIRNGRVVRGWLGGQVQDLTPAVAKVFGVPKPQGAVVDDVSSNSPAAGAGLKQGDVIVGLNGRPVESGNDLRLRIAAMPPGTIAHLQIWRDRKSQEITVKVGELTEKRERAALDQSTAESADSALTGLHVDNLTPEITHALGLPTDITGVVVTTVADGSPAATAGLQHGDVIEQVNDRRVMNTRDFREARQRAGKEAVLLLVNRGGQAAFVTIAT